MSSGETGGPAGRTVPGGRPHWVLAGGTFNVTAGRPVEKGALSN